MHGDHVKDHMAGQGAKRLSRSRFRPSQQWRETLYGYGFVLPALILVAIIAFYPIVQSIWYSLQNYVPSYPQFGSKWVGLANYSAVFHDATFTSSIGNTVFFMVVTVAIEFVLGLLFALVLNQKFAGRGLARTAVLVPWAFTTVISALVWKDLFWQNNVGVIPAGLHVAGLVPADWAPLASNGTLMAAMIVVDVWKTSPFMALLLLAGLQIIPDDIYEAGRVDGANLWQRFALLTMPLLKPAILVALLYRVLDAWRVFDLFYVIAGSRLESVSLYTFNQVVVSDINFPIGEAASTITFAGAIVIAIIFVKGLGTQTAS